MGILKREDGDRYESFLYPSSLAESPSEVLCFIGKLCDTDGYDATRMAIYGLDSTVSLQINNRNKWIKTLKSKVQHDNIMAIAIEGFYQGKLCDIGIGIRTGNISFVIKRNNPANFFDLVQEMGLEEKNWNKSLTNGIKEKEASGFRRGFE